MLNGEGRTSNEFNIEPAGLPVLILSLDTTTRGGSIAILSYGARLGEALAAAEILQGRGLSTTVADARFAKPLDASLIDTLAKEHEILLTVEEGTAGGFGSFVAMHLARTGQFDAGLRFRPLFMPDVHVDQAGQADMYAAAGLDRHGIVAAALAVLDRQKLMRLKGKEIS